MISRSLFGDDGSARVLVEMREIPMLEVITLDAECCRCRGYACGISDLAIIRFGGSV